ncbi:unnamed protein product [Fusarium graminearum]|uniref:Chromosome 1, complete genome n=1 Tax=Gibberella zeae (strain ATCC MYA-4620 / CBS 123657 / FGSC 9075 / NRRL 31084 / PH-1) TaxID=229533 RepID=A0A098D459_GIBZE|nr:unnamed protein product [Fusarium graminearum]
MVQQKMLQLQFRLRLLLAVVQYGGGYGTYLLSRLTLTVRPSPRSWPPLPTPKDNLTTHSKQPPSTVVNIRNLNPPARISAHTAPRTPAPSILTRATHPPPKSKWKLGRHPSVSNPLIRNATTTTHQALDGMPKLAYNYKKGLARAKAP